MKRLLLLGIFSAFYALMLAQPPGRPGGGERQFMPYAQRPAIGSISGTVLDSTTGQPLVFATVTVILSRREGGDTLVNGGLSDEKGRFFIDQMRPGRYKVKIDFMGYVAREVGPVMVMPQNPMVDIGNVSLEPGTITLEEVTISAEKEFMEIGIDRKIYNTEKLLTTAGGSATDLLANIPSIEVDIDGNISLRGTGNVTVLIDGRPSGLTGSDRAAILEQIPASSIEKIEVITNPSAKYDPDGMSGIINIVMKKNKWLGFNGAVTLSAGTGDKYNGSLNLNYRNQKFNVFANYSYRLDNRWGEGLSSRKNILDSTYYVLDQDNQGERQRSSHLLRVGGDLYLNSKNTLSATAMISPRGNTSSESILYQTSDPQDVVLDLFQRKSEETGDGFNMDYNLSYEKKFSQEDRLLQASVNYSQSWGDEVAHFQQQDLYPDMTPIPGDPQLQNNLQDNAYTVTTLQVDYVHPLPKNHKIEAGYKSIFRKIDNDFQSETFNYSEGEYVSDTALNNRFLYEEEVHAVYGTFSGKTKRWGYQAGLRVEQALTLSTLVTTEEEFENNYFNLFPSAFLTYQLTESQEFQLNYSRRIDRPSTRQLNPFTDYSDPLNLRRGNPFLQPEYIHAFEFNYSKRWESTTFSGSVYYRRTNNAVQRVSTVDSNGVATTTFENLTTADSYGLELIAVSKVFDWWNLNASFNFYRSIINGENLDANLSNNGFGWSARINNQFKLPWDMEAQLSSIYIGPRPTAQGSMKAFYWTDIALKKNFLDNKASLSIRVSDIFDTRQFRMNSSGDNFEQDMTRKRESRIGFLTFSYRFGQKNMDRKRRMREDGGERDDMGDMDME